METVTSKLIHERLEQVGVARGQIVYLQIDMRMIGRVHGADTRDAYCKTYLDAVLDLVGLEGTVVVPTYSTQVARFDIPFLWEETPTVLGNFPEYVRRDPRSLRSLHPLHSVTAIGRSRELICADNGPSDFGWGSPFDRMLATGAKCVTVGLESGYVVGIAHHLDAACCLPYVYNKLLKWRPIVNGRPVTRDYFACVRHLDLDVQYYLKPMVQHVRKLGGIRSVKLGGSWVHMGDYRQIFEATAGILRDQPYFMLKKPPVFTYGKVPFDGPTAGRDGISEGESQERIQHMNWAGYYLDRGSPGGDEDELE